MFTFLFILDSIFQAKKFDSKEAAYDWAFEQDLITIVAIKPYRAVGEFPNDHMKGYHLLDTYGYRGTIGLTDLAAADYLIRNPKHQLAQMV